MGNVVNIYALGIKRIYRFLILQLLWIMFTVVGLVVCGIFPATFALFETLKEPTDLTSREYITFFINIYKRSFIQMNKAAIIWQVMLVLMGMNLFIFRSQSIYIYLVIFGMLIMMILCIIYFLENFTIKRKVFDQVKHSFGYMFLYPKRNIMIMAILFILIIVYNLSPGITFFFGTSITASFILKTKFI